MDRRGAETAPASPPAIEDRTSAQPDDAVTQVAGTYRLTEKTDGTVSGDFSYVYLDPYENEGLARVTADSTLDPAATSTVSATETGFTFTANVIQRFSVVPPQSAPSTKPGHHDRGHRHDRRCERCARAGRRRGRRPASVRVRALIQPVKVG